MGSPGIFLAWAITSRRRSSLRKAFRNSGARSRNASRALELGQSAAEIVVRDARRQYADQPQEGLAVLGEKVEGLAKGPGGFRKARQVAQGVAQFPARQGVLARHAAVQVQVVQGLLA